MKIIIATRNEHKLEEIRTILGNIIWELTPLSELDPNLEVIEDGKTFEENARKKAESVMEKFGYITLGEDTGLEVDFLNGQPGIYSARFAGAKATYEQNRIKLLLALRNIPILKRTARFRCTCALAFPKSFNRETQIFDGVCDGQIIEAPRGKGGFGYDPVFMPKGYDNTFAELQPEEKNKISHRAQALIKVKGYLEYIKTNEQ